MCAELHNSPVVMMAMNVPAIAHKPPPLASQACRDRQLFEEWVVRLVSVLFRKRHVGMNGRGRLSCAESQGEEMEGEGRPHRSTHTQNS